ncbi:MAG: hypothetical protein Q9182_005178 [Xanthomendoza sp. 2 TL-2023]
MSCRQAAVHQINEMTGPTLTTLPVRTVIDWRQSVEAYLDKIQQEMTEMIPYEQTGLQNMKRIAEIEAVHKTELDIIWTWNATVPTTIEARVHDLIADTCLIQPHAIAIDAWDGIWTYAEVHDMSNCLAHHLVHLGVGCETVVPLCFEKSKWTPIAMLAVMRAGGTCVTLDPALPQDPGSLRRFRVTHVELTPSTASILPNETIKSLDTLILGGERLSEEQANEWASLVPLKNSYGPCECTPAATVADICPGGNMTTIGTGLGVNPWIVDAASGQSLVLVGSIGELALEGLLVGPGYLEPSTSTFSAFLEDPVWLLHGTSGRTGRKGRPYRTGDLVSYIEDGSLTFVGRKDAQVKIHSQRLELGNIENYIKQSHQVRQSACILPQIGLCANTLVGLISVKHTSETGAILVKNGFILSLSASASSALTTGVTFADSDSSTAEAHAGNAEICLEQLATTVSDCVEALKSYLDNVLPFYMVPTIWVVLKDIPLDPSGKTSRRQLADWLSSMDSQTYNLVTGTNRIPILRQPITGAERLLQHACSVVLNV